MLFAKTNNGPGRYCIRLASLLSYLIGILASGFASRLLGGLPFLNFVVLFSSFVLIWDEKKPGQNIE
jgi:hypothetical protein